MPGVCQSSLLWGEAKPASQLQVLQVQLLPHVLLDAELTLSLHRPWGQGLQRRQIPSSGAGRCWQLPRIRLQVSKPIILELLGINSRQFFKRPVMLVPCTVKDRYRKRSLPVECIPRLHGFVALVAGVRQSELTELHALSQLLIALNHLQGFGCADGVQQLLPPSLLVCPLRHLCGQIG